MNIIDKISLVNIQNWNVVGKRYFRALKHFLEHATLLLLSIYFFPPVLIGQSFDSTSEYIANVQHFGVEDGLSHRDVFCTFQDSRGFIWVGTQYGLNRFEGHGFRTFTAEKNGLTSNIVHQIFEDGEGWLWVIKNKNPRHDLWFQNISLVNIYTLETRSLEDRLLVPLPFKIPQLHSVKSGSKGTVFFGTRTGELWKYDVQNGFISYYKGEKTQEININHIDKNNNIYFGTQRDPNSAHSNLMIMDAKGENLTSMAQNVKYFGEDEAGKINFWHRPPGRGLTSVSFFSYEGKGSFQKRIIPGALGNKLWDLSLNRNFIINPIDYSIWSKSKNHFFVFSFDGNVLFDFSEKYGHILKNEIQNVQFDKWNNAWVATAFGLYKIKLKPSPFKNYFSLPLEDYNINSGFSCRGILTYKNKLWVNSTQARRGLKDLNSGKEYFLEVPLIKTPDLSLIGRRIFHTVLPFDEEQILMSSNSLYLYNFEEDRYTMIPSMLKEGYPLIWHLSKDSQGEYWMGLESTGLEKWDGFPNPSKPYAKYNQFTKLQKSTVYHVCEFDEKHLLVASTSGLYVLHREKGIIERFWRKGKAEHFIPLNVIHHIYQDKEQKNVIWLATAGGGLLKLTINNEAWKIEKLEQFTVVDGLSSNVLHSIYEDDQKTLWISSDYGLIRFHKESQVATSFLEKDGISHNEFNRISHFQAEDGTLYFGGLNGITAFHPNDIEDLEGAYNKPLEVLNFQQYSGTTDKIEDKTRPFLLNPVINLQPGDRFFRLDFSLLEYQDISRQRYFVKIEGLDDEWNIQKENNLRVSGLPYGNYSLRIRGQSADGKVSKNELTIPINVLKPFYLEMWFLVIALIGLSGSIFLFLKWRTKELQERKNVLEKTVKERTATIAKQTEELRELDNLKSHFFANISHELRTPLTLMLAPIANILKSQQLNQHNKNHLETAQRNGQRLHKMISEILDLTKLESGKLELIPSNIVFYNFLRVLIANFESLANNKDIQLKFQYDAPRDLQIEVDVEKLEIILINLLSNAFKFTEKGGTISLSAKENGQQLQLQISDTGRGIHPDDLPNVFNRFYQTKRKDAIAEGGTGIGLALSREFVQLMNGNIEVESELDKGSTFFVTIPKIEVMGQLSNEAALLIENEKLKIEESKLNIEHAEYSETPLGESPLPFDSEKSTILLVEDNGDLSAFVRSLLETRYNVMIAENGKEALERLTVDGGQLTENKQNDPPSTVKLQPSLIITDLMMPIMDGFQLIRELKNNDAYRHLPIIVLSARAELKDKIDTLRIGVDDYMLKPFVEDELFARVENLLKNRKERQSSVHNPPATSNKQQATNNQHLTTEQDLEWLKSLEEKLKAKLGNSNFKVDDLLPEFGMNRTYFYQKIKKLTGLTPNQHLQEMRLNEARYLLETQSHKAVKSIAYEVGFKDPVYFARLFKKRFGKLPSAYSS